MVKSLIQCWVIIAITGTIGLTALAWNGTDEKGSPIDSMKVTLGAKGAFKP